jgi:hypothetical protein
MPTTGRQDADRDIEARIIALAAVTTGELRIEWRRLYRATPPTRLSRDLLLRGAAYKLQEQVYGGLAPQTARRLRLLTSDPNKGRAAFMPAPSLKPGTRLVREWHGRTHSVITVEGGFDYEGERYRSLSEIARRITGSHRSGPLFFGLTRRPSPTMEGGR